MVKKNNTTEEKTPFISIAIASYNYGKYLQRGFEAICRQSYKDFEVVYLDDASTDNSIEVIENFRESFPDIRIKLVQNTHNMGILYSKSRLIRECSGEYIMLCDADDWMADECLEKLASAAMTTKADRIVSEVVNIGDDGKIIQVQKLPQQPSRWLWNIHHGCLYKRSIAVDNNITILHEPDDVYFITMFNLYCKSTQWIHEPLYYWYVHKDSAGRKTGTNDDTIMLEKFDDMLEYIKCAIEQCEITDKESREYLEILAMKIYYLQIFHSMRYYSVSQKIKSYSKLRSIMKSYFPDYTRGRYELLSPKYIRKYAYYIIKLSRIIEKLHLMKPALAVYHLLAKIVYIDQ